MKNSKEIEKVFSSDHVMSLLENMSDGIQLISEQHGEVIQRLDKLDGRVDNLEIRFDRLEIKVDNLEVRFDNLETSFDNFEIKVDNLQEDVTEIKHKLAQKVDLEDFQKLEKRLMKVENFMLNFAKK